MLKVVITLVLSPAFLLAGSGGLEPSWSNLLDQYAANQDKASSWVIAYEIRQMDTHRGSAEARQISGEIHFDGNRVLLRERTIRQSSGSGKPGEGASPLSIGTQLWDGKQHVNYTQIPGEGPGSAQINSPARPNDVKALLHNMSTGVLFGDLGAAFLRIDDLFRHHARGQLHVTCEVVRGTECYAIEADTDYGRHKVWLDPTHGYSVAKARIEQSGDKKHLIYTKPLLAGSERHLDVDCLRFERFGDMWMGVEANSVEVRGSKAGDYDRMDTSLRATQFIPNPDAERLGTFGVDFIPEGANVWIYPIAAIQYVWHEGKPVAQYDERIVRQLDGVLDSMTQAPARGPLACVGDSPAKPVAETDIAAMLSPVTGFDLPGTIGGHSGAMSPWPLGPDANVPVMAPLDRPIMRKAHCGLYCVYSVLRLSGQNVDFRDLVKPEYLSSFEGSSLPDLVRAGLGNGLYAVGVAKLTPRLLRQSTWPAILHVRGDSRSPKYDHYELLVGTEEGKAKMFNPPAAPELVSFGELAGRWDGTAVFVSDRPPDVEKLLDVQRQFLLKAGGIGALAIILMHGFGQALSARTGPLSNRRRIILSAAQAAGVGLAAVLFGLLAHVGNGEGLLANREGVQSLQKAHLAGFLPRVGVRQVERLAKTDAVFVDARLSVDFQAGHLRNSLSVPVDGSDWQRHQATEHLSKTQRIVVYGQSRACPYAKMVAARLVEDGFRDVAVFRGGWVEWTARHPGPVIKETPKADGIARGQG